MTEIAVAENFDNPQGAFSNYDTFDTAQRFNLPKQKHVDIRTFEADDVRVGVRMLYLSSLTMATLSGQTMGDLTSAGIAIPSESWTAGVVATQADRNNWNGLTLECTTGTNVTESVL